MRNSVLLVGILSVGACVEQPIQQDAVPRVVLNALSPTAFASSQLTTSVLNSTNAAAMGTTNSARKLLSFATTCALDATQSIDFTVSGVQYHAVGLMGIAPSWTTSALSASDAAWVSACVVSRVNLTSSAVTISARGDNAGYDTTIDSWITGPPLPIGRVLRRPREEASREAAHARATALERT